MLHNWKRFLLPLLILLGLIVVLVLLLLVTRTPKDETAPTTVPTETTVPALITPEEAANNLFSAQSFRLIISMLNEADSYSYENAYSFQMSKTNDGGQIILFSQASTMNSGAESFESAGDQAYYHGNTAYIRYITRGFLLQL